MELQTFIIGLTTVVLLIVLYDKSVNKNTNNRQ